MPTQNEAVKGLEKAHRIAGRLENWAGGWAAKSSNQIQATKETLL